MIISEIGIKGYKSFGNNEQVLKLDTDKGKLILLVGNNGNGKSVIPSTNILAKIPIGEFSIDEFNTFLGIMGEESVYVEYIRVNNTKLYEQYQNQ